MLDVSALGERVQRLRRSRGLALADLAEASGVSVSMLSAVAEALGVTLAQLLAAIEPGRAVLRRAGEHDVVDEPGGWQRTLLTPVVPGVGFEWIRTTLPAGCDAGLFPGYAPGSHEFVHVETGTLHLTARDVTHELHPGDTLYFPSDADHAYANRGDIPCTYSVAALNMRSREPGSRPTRRNRSR
jgi:quercetin dioxygenase-like cupin family protein